MASQRLLVADDSLTIQKVIRLALSNDGYEIQAVSTGDDAAQQIALFRPSVVLVDVGIPGKSAFDLKKEFNAHPDFKHVRFILMSSAFKPVDEKKIHDAGFDGRLIKPFDPANLRQLLGSLDLSASLVPGGAVSPGVAPVEEATPEPPRPKFVPPQSPLIQPSVRKKVDPPAPTAAVIPPEPPMSDAPMNFKRPDDDIRHLTSTTLQASGVVDDSQWAMHEPAKKQTSVQELQSEYQDFSKVPAFEPEENVAEINWEDPFPAASASAEAKVFSSPGQPIQVDQEALMRQMKEEIRQEVQKMLPDLTERLIREELHRMLRSVPR